MIEKIKTVVVDKNHLTRKAYLALLRQSVLFDILGDTCNINELEYLLNQSVIDLVILDSETLNLEDFDLLIEIKAKYTNCKIVLLSSNFTESVIFQFVKFGVSGFVLKSDTVEKFIETLEYVFKNGFYYNDKVFKAIKNNSLLLNSELTEREEGVLKLICNGKSHKQIADLLKITIRTVNFHKRNLYVKTKQNSNAGLVLYALNSGIFINNHNSKAI